MTDVRIRVIGEDHASRELAKIDSGIATLAKQLGVAAIATAALKKTLDFAKESTVLAARVETLGAVTEVMGKNAGLTSQEIDKLEKSIQAQGITTQASRQALAQMMRAEIDLANATDLARLAQDAAVISGENSSQAFDKLTQIIGTGNTYMARHMGLLVDFEGAYDRLAQQLGKNADDLTQLEKVQARTNEVMAQGRTIAGAYEAAMETGGKKAQSYARHLEELKLQVGNLFVDAFSLGVDVITELTDGLTTLFEADNLLNDAVKAGNMSWEERLAIHLQVIATGKTAADVVEELTEEEEERNKIAEQGNKIFAQAKTYEAYKDRLLDLAFATREVNAGLVLMTEGQWIATKEVADADAVLIGYINHLTQADEIEQGFIGTGEKMADTQRSIGDEMERRDQRIYNAADAYNALAAAERAAASEADKLAAAQQAVAEGMGRYFDMFNENMTEMEMADKIQGAFSDHLVDLALSGQLSAEQLEGLKGALAEIDPTAASALEQALALSQGIDAITQAALDTGDWSGFTQGLEYLMSFETVAVKDALTSGAEGIRALGLAAAEEQEAIALFNSNLAAGMIPVEAAGMALEKVGIVGPAALGVMGKLITDLDGTHVPADGLLERLHSLVDKPWKVQVDVTYNDPGWSGPGGGGGGTPTTGGGGNNRDNPRGIRGASGLDFTVPPGYPNDSYPMWVQSGEHVQVTPANQSTTDARSVNIQSVTFTQPMTPDMFNAFLMEALRG